MIYDLEKKEKILLRNVIAILFSKYSCVCVCVLRVMFDLCLNSLSVSNPSNGFVCVCVFLLSETS